MTNPSHRIPILCCLVALLLGGAISCVEEGSGPPLVVQRDSAGIRIVETMRPLWGDSSRWIIDPDPIVDLALSGIGPSHEFFGVGSVMQRPDGSLAVTDRNSQEVRVYSESGEFQGSLGGPGQGPGEFSNLQRIKNAGDTLLALDYDGRVTVVAPDLAVIRTLNLPYTTTDLYYLGSGRILTESWSLATWQDAANELVRPPEALMLFDLEGTRVDSIGETLGAESYVHREEERRLDYAALFGKRSHITVLGHRIFRGPSDMMQVEELNMSGGVVRILRVAGYPLDLTDARISAEREAYLTMGRPPGTPVSRSRRQLVAALPAPATRPAYSEMFVDPSGALWLELYRGMSEQDRPQEWLILDADGTWLGTVEVPDRFRVTDITMEAVLGVWRDELDVEHPQMLRLTRDAG